jgi:hypothetical protein
VVVHVPDVPPEDLASITLPEALRAALSPREHRLTIELLNGAELKLALKASGYRSRSLAYRRISEAGIPLNVARALQNLISQAYGIASENRRWIKENLVKTYERAAEAVEIKDTKGRGIGVFKFDGPTCARTLELLGKDLGMFSQTVTHDLAGDVKSLLAAIASRGKPSLEQRRAPVTLDQEPTPVGKPVDNMLTPPA